MEKCPKKSRKIRKMIKQRKNILKIMNNEYKGDYLIIIELFLETFAF